MRYATEDDYKKITNEVGWFNFPKALILILVQIAESLTAIKEALERRNG